MNSQMELQSRFLQNLNASSKRLKTLFFILAVSAAHVSNAENLCSDLFISRHQEIQTLDLQQDFKIFGGLTYVTDGMGTLQRINPNKAFWAVSNSKLESPPILTRQLHIDKSQVENTGTTSLQIDLEKPEPLVTLELGSLTRFQKDPNFFNMRLQRNIDLRFTDGLSFQISSPEVLEMEVIISANAKWRDDDQSNMQRFEHPQVYKSSIQMIPKHKGSKATQFYWKNFKGLTNGLPLTDSVLVDKIWITFRNPGKLKKINLHFSGPIYAIQDVFGENSNSRPEKFWKGIGNYFAHNQFAKNTPMYLLEPLSQTFKDKIRHNLYDKQNQLAAIQALRAKTLEGELKNIGFEYHVFAEKFEPSQFFRFFSFIEKAKIPIESGEFGDYHGAEVHAAQIYAITRGMSDQEIALFRNLYREIGHNAFFGWKIWTSLFDSPDPQSPTSPRYWKLLQQNTADSSN